MSAEGMVVVLPQNHNDFFCHTCDLNIKIRNPSDFTCPRCKLGFIEELTETVEETTNLLDNSTDNIRRFLERFPNRYTRNNITTSPYYRIANEILTPILSGASGSGSGTSGINNRRRTARTAALDSIIQEITVSVGGGSDGSIARSMIVMGNPRDYAWGREGLEAVMSQLLNQFEYAGPPPLTKDQMNDISKETITTEQVDAKLQCAICFDDFQFEEIVRKLDCSHYYHEQCIFPWVKQHATCPVCRKNLNADHETTESVSSEDSIMMAIRAAAESRESTLRHTINVLNRSQATAMPDLIPNAGVVITDESIRNIVRENLSNDRHRRGRRLELDSDSDSNSNESRSCPYTTSSSSSSVVFDNETPSDDIMNVSDISNPDSLAPRRSVLTINPAIITSSGRRQNGAVLRLERSQTPAMPVFIPNSTNVISDDSFANIVRENLAIAHHRRGRRLEVDSDSDSNSIESRTCPLTSSSSSSSGISVNENPSDDVMIVSDTSSPDDQQRSESNEECSQPSQKKSKSH